MTGNTPPRPPPRTLPLELFLREKKNLEDKLSNFLLTRRGLSGLINTLLGEIRFSEVLEASPRLKNGDFKSMSKLKNNFLVVFGLSLA